MITRAWVESLNEEVEMRLEAGEDAQYILEDLLRRLEEMSKQEEELEKWWRTEDDGTGAL